MQQVRFQVNLDQTIHFQDNYECALVDFMCTTKTFGWMNCKGYLHPYLDICVPNS